MTDLGVWQPLSPDAAAGVLHDLVVFEDSPSELDDADELAGGMTAGHIPLAEAATAPTSADRLCAALRRHWFSGQAFLAEFAPDLPR